VTTRPAALPGARALWLQAHLGDSRLLARPGDRRLHLLDAQAGLLWDLHTAGFSQAEVIPLLSERFGLSLGTAREQVERSWAGWVDAGLLDTSNVPHTQRLEQPDDPRWPLPRAASPPRDALLLSLGDRRVSLQCDDQALWAQLQSLLTPTPTAATHSGSVDHQLRLQGANTAWHLSLDAEPIAHGEDLDAALVTILSTLTELGCRPTERLMVIHGAGLVSPDARGLLLVAPGGSGKSTLAAALDTRGLGLLSDDVVPVTLEGELLGLGLPLCLKPGSWPVLERLRPSLAAASDVQRFGRRVRYLPAHTPAPSGTVEPALLLFPRYGPGQPARCEPVTPEQALQQLIEAEAVLRALDQTKLEALAAWVERLPAYAMRYPDLETGLSLIRELMLASKASADEPGPVVHAGARR